MSTGPINPDSFRVEGHACAITLPGMKDEDVELRFQPTPEALALWRARYPAGAGEAPETPPAPDSPDDA